MALDTCIQVSPETEQAFNDVMMHIITSYGQEDEQIHVRAYQTE